MSDKMMPYPNECVLDAPMIFDTHAHLDDKKFDGIRDGLIDEMHKNGVKSIVTCGCDKSSSIAALSIAEKYDFVYAAVGIHPENLNSNTTVEEIRELSKHKKCVAIGEIGLDYNWDKEHKPEQTEVFEKQIILAKELGLPVIVHDRDAHEDTLAILKKHRPAGVVHCFSGSPEMASEVLKLGMYIGIGGVITFKNARRLPEVATLIPSSRLLLETDCPYLAPEPYRGTLNHSGMITLTAQKIAEIRGTDLRSLLELTDRNAREMFKI